MTDITKTTYESRRQTAIDRLIANWHEVIAADTAEGMQGIKESMMGGLVDQIMGYHDR